MFGSTMRNKQNERICKQFAATGSCPFSPRCRFSHQLPSASPSPPPPSISVAQNWTNTTTETAGDWSPLDDGIEVRLRGSSPTDKPPSREEVYAYINNLLNGPPQASKWRLPALEEICPSGGT